MNSYTIVFHDSCPLVDVGDANFSRTQQGHDITLMVLCISQRDFRDDSFLLVRSWAETSGGLSPCCSLEWHQPDDSPQIRTGVFELFFHLSPFHSAFGGCVLFWNRIQNPKKKPSGHLSLDNKRVKLRRLGCVLLWRWRRQNVEFPVAGAWNRNWVKTPFDIEYDLIQMSEDIMVHINSKLRKIFLGVPGSWEPVYNFDTLLRSWISSEKSPGSCWHAFLYDDRELWIHPSRSISRLFDFLNGFPTRSAA